MKLVITAPLYVSKQAHIDFIDETIKSIKTKHDYEIIFIENYIDPLLRSQVMEVLNGKGDIIKNPIGNNVAAGWNEGIREALKRGAEYVLIPNLDIIFHPEAIDNLVEFADNWENPGVFSCSEWTNRRTINNLKIEPVSKDGKIKLDIFDGETHHDWDAYDTEHPHFSCFMVSFMGIERLAQYEKDFAEPELGLFDPGYVSAYFEDQDYHQRILMAKHNGVQIEAIKVNSAIFYHYGSRTIKSDEQLERENTNTYEKNRIYFKNKFGYDSHGLVPTNGERVQLSFPYPFNIPPRTS